MDIPKGKEGFKGILYKMRWSENLNKFSDFDKMVADGYRNKYSPEKIKYIYDGLIWAIENMDELNLKEIFPEMMMPKELVLKHFEQTVRGMEIFCEDEINESRGK